jgi:hypothetical protein
MPEHMKSPGLPTRDGQMIQPVVHHIHNLTTAQTNQMMVHAHIPVKPRHSMTHVDFLYQPGFPQDTQRVVNSIAGYHRLLTLHQPIQVLGSRMTRGPGQGRVNGRPLTGDTNRVPAKTSLNVLRIKRHTSDC